MGRRRLTTIAATFGLLVGLGTSAIGAQAATAAPDATFNTLLTSYTALADRGGSACVGGTITTTATTTTCTILQPAPGHTGRNVAVCVQNNTPGTIQVCDITQTNATANNYALVIQRRSQSGGSAQEATQFADVEQMNGSGSNFLGEFQLITQTTGDANMDDPSQTNNQYLGSDSDETQQTATAGGSNFALLAQRSRQFGSAETAAQTQNSNQVGRLNQVDVGALGGLSLNFVSQDQLQHLDGNGPQTQTVDPRCCSNQGTNPNDSFNIRQQTDQEGGPQAVQDAKTLGTCRTSGKCTVNQSSTQQGQTTTNQCGPATSCTAAITCTGGVCTAAPTCGEFPSCPPPPPCPPVVCPPPPPPPPILLGVGAASFSGRPIASTAIGSTRLARLAFATTA